MKINRILLSLLLLSAFYPASYLPAHAQTYVESDKGYWQVHTDPNTRNTIVQFYDGGNQLLYQESMSRKYVKLTKRNIRLFDDLLSKLMAKELLSAKVKTYDLVADSRAGLGSMVRPELEMPVAGSGASVKTAMSNIYVVKQGKMKVILKNPSQERYDIRIIDPELRTIYQESVDGLSYGRWFDMSKLAQGTYNIHISSPRKKLNYKLTVDDYLGYRLDELK